MKTEDVIPLLEEKHREVIRRMVQDPENTLARIPKRKNKFKPANSKLKMRDNSVDWVALDSEFPKANFDTTVLEDLESWGVLMPDGPVAKGRTYPDYRLSPSGIELGVALRVLDEIIST